MYVDTVVDNYVDVDVYDLICTIYMSGVETLDSIPNVVRAVFGPVHGETPINDAFLALRMDLEVE